MIKKLLLGTLTYSVTAFLGAIAWYAGLFGKQQEQWMTDNAACVRQMDEIPMLVWALAVLSMGFLGALSLHKLNISSAKSGAMTGLTLYFFIGLMMSCAFHITLRSYDASWLPIDVAGNSLGGLLGGAATGWLYSKLSS